MENVSFSIVFLVEVRDLPYSDRYRRSIASSREGFTRHCRDAILPKSHNPHTFPLNEKTALDTRFLHFWWKCEGICPTAIVTIGQSRAAERGSHGIAVMRFYQNRIIAALKTKEKPC